MSWTDTFVMVLDFETTSIDACTTRPVQIGFAIFDPSSSSFTNELNVIVNSGVKSTHGALKVHGITETRVLREGVPVKEAFESLVETITKYSDYPIMMYNAPFDFTILNQECKRHGLQLPKLNVLDPLVWAQKFCHKPHKLGVIAKRFKISHADAHDALADVQTTARVALSITPKNRSLRTASITDLQRLQKEWSRGDWPTRLCAQPSQIKNEKMASQPDAEYPDGRQGSIGSSENIVSLLERLFKLLESGAITASEYDEQKRRILKGSSTPDQLSKKDDIDLDGWDLPGAAHENRVDIARALIARGDEVDGRDLDGYTPLHVAAVENSLDVAHLLIDRGAEVDARDENGRTPLHLAAEGNSLDVAILLLNDKGTVVDARDNYGWTPSHVAAYFNSRDVARLLIEHGANTDGIDLSWMDDH